jgi:hypothetical protein
MTARVGSCSLFICKNCCLRSDSKDLERELGMYSLRATLHDPTGLGTTYRAWKDGNLQVLCTLLQPVGPGRIDGGSSFQALQVLFLAPTCRARKDL